MSTEIATLPRLEIENPAANYKLATDVAGLCKEIVVKSAVDIHGKKYVRAEGWQAIATAHGCVASARDVKHVEGGIRAIGELRKVSDGAVIATAEGFVGDDEATWAKRPEYARRAMCQTRAISRACRSAFAHVVVLMDAGLSTTPAEEVPAEGFDEHREPQPARSRAMGYKLDRPVKAACATDEPDTSADDASEPFEGDWREVAIHFGKNKGMTLAKLEPHSLKWYQTEWQPKPFRGRVAEDDKRLRAALDASIGGGNHPQEGGTGTDAEDDEVPY